MPGAVQTTSWPPRTSFPGSGSRGAPGTQAGRAHVDKPDEQNKSEEDSADIVPCVLIHGENERRADAAGTDKAEHGRLADVDIEPIEHSRGKRRAELRMRGSRETPMARSAS